MIHLRPNGCPRDSADIDCSNGRDIAQIFCKYQTYMTGLSIHQTILKIKVNNFVETRKYFISLLYVQFYSLTWTSRNMKPFVLRTTGKATPSMFKTWKTERFFLGVPFTFYLSSDSTGVGASYWVGRLPDEGDVQIEWMTGVLCNGLICQQVSSKKELNILPCVLAKSNLRRKYKDLTKIFQDRNIYSMECETRYSYELMSQQHKL